MGYSSIERSRVAKAHGFGRWMKGRKLTDETKSKIIASRAGYRHSDETKKKLRDANLGKKYSAAARAKMSAAQRGLKRKPHTAEARLKMSLAAKGRPKSEAHKQALSLAKIGKPNLALLGKKRPDITGDKNPRWRNDRTTMLERQRLRGTLEWKTWRDQVFERDKFCCQECQAKGVYLEPHHIVPLRDCTQHQLFDINNGIALCRPCHQKTIRKEYEFVERYRSLVS